MYPLEVPQGSSLVATVSLVPVQADQSECCVQGKLRGLSRRSFGPDPVAASIPLQKIAFALPSRPRTYVRMAALVGQ
jgi:hypothetical protein